jgi:hypothetical protein
LQLSCDFLAIFRAFRASLATFVWFFASLLGFFRPSHHFCQFYTILRFSCYFHAIFFNFHAIFCNFLRFSAIFCDFLRFSFNLLRFSYDFGGFRCDLKSPLKSENAQQNEFFAQNIFFHVNLFERSQAIGLLSISRSSLKTITSCVSAAEWTGEKHFNNTYVQLLELLMEFFKLRSNFNLSGIWFADEGKFLKPFVLRIRIDEFVFAIKFEMADFYLKMT